jgi:hypothetical protein
MNRASIGTLIERMNLMVVLAKMFDSTAQSALNGLSEALSAIMPELRAKPSHMTRTGDEQQLRIRFTELRPIVLFQQTGTSHDMRRNCS